MRGDPIPEVILNRDLRASSLPPIRVTRLAPPGQGHEAAWAQLWRFASSFDPARYNREVTEIDPVRARETASAAVTAGRTPPGTLSDLRAALWLCHADGHGATPDAHLIDALLDAIHGHLSSAPRPVGDPPPLEPGLGTVGADIGEGHRRTTFAVNRPMTREQLYDRVAGLLLRSVAQDVTVSALYLYPPQYPMDVDDPVEHTVMLLLERRGSATDGTLRGEHDRLERLMLDDLAGPRRSGCPARTPRERG